MGPTDINAMRKRRRRFKLLVREKEKEVQRANTHSIRRFLKIIRSINWENPHCRVYMRVSDGRFSDNRRRFVEFYNDGEYTNPEEFWQAFDAFIEK